MGTNPLFVHLDKLPAAAASEKSLAQVLDSLWSTRKTGLSLLQKTRIQSLLALPLLQDLDPVLACLRLLIRKSVQEKLMRDDLQKLFPPQTSIELKRILVMLLQKFHGRWKAEASRDKPFWQRTSNQGKVDAPAALTSFPVAEPSTLWPRQGDATTSSNGNNVGSSIPSYVDSNPPGTGTMPLERDNGSVDNLANLPRLKSMTWTMQNQNQHSTPANRVAIITLKLQDYTKSPSGEIEVKFQISKDTLDVILKSMVHISQQLSDLGNRLIIVVDWARFTFRRTYMLHRPFLQLVCIC